ncbi:MAG: hypothetical protein WCF85_18505 [Rhodospirillaceae bacterium]
MKRVNVGEMNEMNARFVEQTIAERGDAWNKIYSAIRTFRLDNMANEDGQAYPLVDLMTADIPGLSISDGEWRMVALADEIFEALYPEKVAAARRAIFEKDTSCLSAIAAA